MPTSLQRDASGMSRQKLAGTRVLFNGCRRRFCMFPKARSMLLCHSNSWLHARFGAGCAKRCHFNSLDVPVLDAAPAVFTVDVFGQAAVLNEDGSLNSVSNPARQGSIISNLCHGRWSAAAGSHPRRGASAPSAKPVLPVRVSSMSATQKCCTRAMRPVLSKVWCNQCPRAEVSAPER